MDNNIEYKIDGKEINLDNMADMFVNGSMSRTIKLLCPTQKLNLNPEDRSHIIGMGMMIEKDLEKNLKLDLADLYDDTIIAINRRQLIESIGIIDGALRLMISNGMIMEYARANYIEELIRIINKNGGVYLYSKFKKYLETLKLSNSSDPAKQKCIDRLDYITNNIWFMTYGDLDNFYTKTVEAFKEDKKDETNGEDDR